MWKHIASNALTLFIGILIVLFGLITWAQNEYVAEGPLEQAMCLQVESGTNFDRLADKLVEEGALSHPSLFSIGVRYSGKDRLLKAGSYLVPEHATMPEIIDIVTRGGANTCGTEIVFQIGVTRNEVQMRELDPVTNRFVELAAFNPAEGDIPEDYNRLREDRDTRYRVQVIEGTTVWNVVDALMQADFLNGEPSDLPPEGTLAPDSYEVDAGADRAALLGRMQSVQSLRLAEAWANRAEGLPLETPEEALILASIVEKETSVPEERALVASVLVNRLNKGWKLQFDPTIIYGITRGVGTFDRPIRQSDKEGVTEQRMHGEVLYNTYVIDGLPAGPIDNPGLAAIQATLNPADTEYMFFVADGTGGHAFAVTGAEHERNVAAWRKIEASSSGN